MNDVILTIEQAALYLQLSCDTLYRYAQSGKVPASRIGKHWRFSKAALGAWVRGDQAGLPGGTDAMLLAAVFPETSGGNGLVASPDVPMNVLVVDDDASIRKLLNAWIGRMGHHVALADTGRQAIELLRQKSYDLVFLDLFLADMTGDKVLVQLPQANPPPVVMISGMADSAEMDFALSHSVVYALSKPFSKVDVEKVVRMFGADAKTLAPG